MEGSESYPYNGRVACLRIYNTAFTDEEVAAFSESWDCPHEPGKRLMMVVMMIDGRL
jgi:hypothetical protein